MTNQIGIDATVHTLENQRNSALNENVNKSAIIAAQEAKISELTGVIKALEEQVKNGKSNKRRKSRKG